MSSNIRKLKKQVIVKLNTLHGPDVIIKDSPNNGVSLLSKTSIVHCHFTSENEKIQIQLNEAYKMSLLSLRAFFTAKESLIVYIHHRTSNLFNLKNLNRKNHM